MIKAKVNKNDKNLNRPSKWPQLNRFHPKNFLSRTTFNNIRKTQHR